MSRIGNRWYARERPRRVTLSAAQLLREAQRCRLGHDWCRLTAGHPGWCEVAGGFTDPRNDGVRETRALR